jgi:hypothetical protein
MLRVMQAGALTMAWIAAFLLINAFALWYVHCLVVEIRAWAFLGFHGNSHLREMWMVIWRSCLCGFIRHLLHYWMLCLLLVFPLKKTRSTIALHPISYWYESQFRYLWVIVLPLPLH